jgi:hypothetical protein
LFGASATSGGIGPGDDTVADGPSHDAEIHNHRPKAVDSGLATFDGAPE